MPWGVAATHTAQPPDRASLRNAGTSWAGPAPQTIR